MKRETEVGLRGGNMSIVDNAAVVNFLALGSLSAAEQKRK
jgi:hypothetical protein